MVNRWLQSFHLPNQTPLSIKYKQTWGEMPLNTWESREKYSTFQSYLTESRSLLLTILQHIYKGSFLSDTNIKKSRGRNESIEAMLKRHHCRRCTASSHPRGHALHFHGRIYFKMIYFFLIGVVHRRNLILSNLQSKSTERNITRQ